MNNEIDKSNLRQVILDYPNQLQIGADFAKDIKFELKNKPSNLIICGMGGSALPGNLLTLYLKEHGIKLPVHIARNYSLPFETDENSLIFISSFSGNTEETVSCFKEALKRKLAIIAFSEGGQVASIAKESNTPHVKYKINFKNFQPRYATTYAFMAMHQVLTNLGISAKMELLPKIDSQSHESYGKILAKKAKNKIPIIYTSERYGLLAKIWKVKINENAKLPAFWNVFPNLNHYEMLSFANPIGDYCAFMLKGPKDHPRIQKRMDLTAELYRDRGIEVEMIDIQEGTFLEKVLNTFVLGDWVSYYLALENNRDPVPIGMVEELKEKMKNA